MPSVLWHCWLHISKGIQPVKNCTLTWLSVWSEVQTCICPSWCHCHSLSLASVKSRLVLPFLPAHPGSPRQRVVKRLCVCFRCGRLRSAQLPWSAGSRTWWDWFRVMSAHDQTHLSCRPFVDNRPAIATHWSLRATTLCLPQGVLAVSN